MDGVAWKRATFFVSNTVWVNIGGIWISLSIAGPCKRLSWGGGNQQHKFDR